MDPVSSDTRISLPASIGLTLQLGLVLGLMRIYRLEPGRGFEVVAAPILTGFAVHSWLPDRFRLPWFLGLGLAAAGLLLRTDGIWLVGLGLGIVGLCHLPLEWRTRAVLVATVAAGLAAARAGLVAVPWGNAVVPVLASMFMFPLILYMQDLTTYHERGHPSERARPPAHRRCRLRRARGPRLGTRDLDPFGTSGRAHQRYTANGLIGDPCQPRSPGSRRSIAKWRCGVPGGAFPLVPTYPITWPRVTASPTVRPSAQRSRWA